jgi:hypothetical protein
VGFPVLKFLKLTTNGAHPVVTSEVKLAESWAKASAFRNSKQRKRKALPLFIYNF